MLQSITVISASRRYKLFAMVLLHCILCTLVLLCGCLSFSASVKTKAYIGTLKLNTTDNAPHTDSPLPFFKFLNTGNEGGAGFAIPPDLSVQPALDGLSDGLPDFLVGGNMFGEV